MKRTPSESTLVGAVLLTLVLAIAVSEAARAGWQTVTDPGLGLETGRGLYIRRTRTFDSIVTVTNNTGAALGGDYRIVIDSSNKPLTGADTFDDGCSSCYALPAATGLANGQTTTLKIRFARGRGRLIYQTHLERFPSVPDPVAAPSITLTTPAGLTTVGTDSVEVSGEVAPDGVVVTVNGQSVTTNNSRFSIRVPVHEGLNTLLVRAVDAQGRAATASATVSRDSTAPIITTEWPTDGQVVNQSVINVTGYVNDIVIGTVSEQDATVTVNGVAAQVSNRGYIAQDVPLSVGDNILSIHGVDSAGNVGVKRITVTYAAPESASINAVSGQNQRGRIFATLPEPLEVRVTDEYGNPTPGVSVVFRVLQGDGLLGYQDADAEPSERAIVVQSGGDGVASARFSLGGRAGEATNRVRVTAAGFGGEIVFLAAGETNLGNRLNVIAGNNQRGAVGEKLPQPLVAAVNDNGNNLVAGARVRFEVLAGGGSFSNGSTSLETVSDADGRVRAEVVLGPEPGLDNQRILATLLDTEETAAVIAGFSLSGLETGPVENTRISGTVLDNQDNPVAGVTMRLEDARGNTLPQIMVSDEQGRFVLNGVPVGPLHLIADASTAPAPTGHWSTLAFKITTIAGADNTLPAPIYLVLLDDASAQTVGVEDTVYTLPDYPGYSLTVKAGSVTFPDGSGEGDLSVTMINANKIPMPPPNGMQPQFITTIQPHGMVFDPPAAITMPNVDGHAPGAQVEMYSFDHDLDEFVTVGVGTVSESGDIIRSNRGQGIIKAGWNCGGTVADDTGCAHSCGVCKAPVNCICEIDDSVLPPEDEPGNCKVVACSGGNPSVIADDSDIPEDPCNACRGGNIEEVFIANVDATVNGKKEEWKLLENGVADFAFSATAESELCDELIYTWEFGDGGSATGANVAHTYDAPGNYTPTVNVQCGACPTMYSDSARAMALELSYEAASVIPADRQRLTLGVGETVILSVNPPVAVQWSLTGNGAIGQVGATTALRVGAPGGTVVANVLSPEGEAIGDVSFDVIEPSGLQVSKIHDVLFEAGEQGVLMIAQIKLLPDTVSFGGVEFQEVSGPASNVRGYFLSESANSLRHNPNPDWGPVGADNVAGAGDIAGYGLRAPPWSDGWFEWDIPNRYRLDGVSREFVHSLQGMGMEGSPDPGRAIVIKGAGEGEAVAIRSVDEGQIPYRVQSISTQGR